MHYQYSATLFSLKVAISSTSILRRFPSADMTFPVRFISAENLVRPYRLHIHHPLCRPLPPNTTTSPLLLYQYRFLPRHPSSSFLDTHMNSFCPNSAPHWTLRLQMNLQTLQLLPLIPYLIARVFILLLRHPFLPSLPVDYFVIALCSEIFVVCFSHRPDHRHFLPSYNPSTVCLQETFPTHPLVPIPILYHPLISTHLLHTCPS